MHRDLRSSRVHAIDGEGAAVGAHRAIADLDDKWTLQIPRDGKIGFAARHLDLAPVIVKTNDSAAVGVQRHSRPVGQGHQPDLSHRRGVSFSRPHQGREDAANRNGRCGCTTPASRRREGGTGLGAWSRGGTQPQSPRRPGLQHDTPRRATRRPQHADHWKSRLPEPPDHLRTGRPCRDWPPKRRPGRRICRLVGCSPMRSACVCIHTGRDLRGEASATRSPGDQQTNSPGDMFFDRILGQPHSSGDLPLRQFVDPSQDQGSLGLGRQRRDRLSQPSQRVAIRAGLFGRRSIVGEMSSSISSSA